MAKVKIPSLHPNFLTRYRPKPRTGVGSIVTRAKKLTKLPTFK